MELAIYKVFRDANIDEDKAQAIAETLNKVIAENSQQFATKADIERHYAVHSKQLATQGDVEKVRLEVENVRFEVENVRLEVEKVRLETKVEIEKVRGEIEKSKNETIKWIIGSMVAIAAAALAAARFIFAS